MKNLFEREGDVFSKVGGRIERVERGIICISNDYQLSILGEQFIVNIIRYNRKDNFISLSDGLTSLAIFFSRREYCENFALSERSAQKARAAR